MEGLSNQASLAVGVLLLAHLGAFMFWMVSVFRPSEKRKND